MKIEKKQWLLYAGIIGVAILVVALAITINIAIQKKKDSEMNNIKEQLVQLGMDKDDVWKMSDDEATEAIDEILKEEKTPGYTFEKSKKEFDQTDEAIAKINGYIALDDWSSITSYVSTIKDKYNFTTDSNLYILNAAEDASKLSNLKVFTENDYKKFLDNSHNEAIYFKVLFKMTQGNFLQYYEDISGLVANFPTFSAINLEKKYDFINNEDEINTDEYYEDLKNTLGKKERHYLYKFKVSGYPYTSNPDTLVITTCYISSYKHNNISVVGCYAEEDGLFSANEWNELIK